ncbi:MAG: hypothetical protein KY453_08425 [Gemmatimonadetes bacterium]|nr:hypothetical protein [Gemmatimonadota bacterium]
MGIEDRIRYLLRAARRAEIEGDDRVAQALRRMADEAGPAGPALDLPRLHPQLGCCAE